MNLETRKAREKEDKERQKGRENYSAGKKFENMKKKKKSRLIKANT